MDGWRLDIGGAFSSVECEGADSGMRIQTSCCPFTGYSLHEGC